MFMVTLASLWTTCAHPRASHELPTEHGTIVAVAASSVRSGVLGGFSGFGRMANLSQNRPHPARPMAADCGRIIPTRSANAIKSLTEGFLLTGVLLECVNHR